MPSEYDALCADLAELYAAKGARTMAKAMPVATRRASPPTFVHPVPPSAFVPRPTAKVEAPAGKPQAQAKPQIQAPALPAVARRLAMLKAADRTEAMAKSLTDAGRLTGAERRLVEIQIAQVRRDAAAIRS